MNLDVIDFRVFAARGSIRHRQREGWARKIYVRGAGFDSLIAMSHQRSDS